MRETVQKGILKTSKSTLVVGLLILFLGIIAIMYPAMSSHISTLSIGIILTVGGLFRFTFAIFSYSVGSMIMRYLFAIIMIISGIWIFSNPDMGLEALTMFMAIYFIADGITLISYSLTLHVMASSIYMLIGGILSVIFGVMIFYNWPESSHVVIGIYLGIKIIFDGLMLILTSYMVRKSRHLIDQN
jgi:uncharacterized membrane protein HdeD (DUF308 family)